MIVTVKISLTSLFTLAKYALKHQQNFFPVAKSLLMFNKKIRISVSAIFLFEHDDRFVLIRNHHRPEFYGPIGGVYKHSGNKPEIFNKIEWNSDYTSHSKKKSDMKNDIRGVIFGKRFPEFIDWYTTHQGRENEQCLFRELREELKEGNASKKLIDESSNIKICMFRSVVEGPHKVKDRDYYAQFRCFDIYKIDNTDEETNIFSKKIFDIASHGQMNMILVSKEDITRGRMPCGEKLIANHTKYYFSSEWHEQEPARY